MRITSKERASKTLLHRNGQPPLWEAVDYAAIAIVG